MPNHLAGATSPYLLQHADNPVDWREWGEEAFAEARGRDVPGLVSGGYAACHWCHVMAHESFEDPATAAQMNAGFVCVKVDREERPDVDSVYMAATQALTGSGGWPMTVFTTPDGAPFYCGTYFPPRPHPGMPSFRQVLGAVTDAWTGQREELEQAGGRIVEGISSRLDLGAPTPLSEDLLDAAVGALADRHDRQRGGFGGAPKFPPSMVLAFLLPAPAGRGGARAAARETRSGWRPARPRRWPAAASTTSWPAASPATRWTTPGWCRTSRRCSTTTRCCCGCTRTCGGRPVPAGPAGSPTRPLPSWFVTWAPARGASPRRWTPTPRASRG